MRWWERHFGHCVHVLFLFAAFFVVPVHAQRDNGYLQEKVREQERHIDNTDKLVEQIRELEESDRENIGEYKAYFLGVSGAIAFLNLFGLIKQFNKGKESNG